LPAVDVETATLSTMLDGEDLPGVADDGRSARSDEASRQRNRHGGRGK
jgi:hypothetical protein